jgi:hypothetical protein
VQQVTLAPGLTPVDQAIVTLTDYITTSAEQAPVAHAGDQIVLVATVNPLHGRSGAEGAVDFSDGTADLGAVPLYSDAPPPTPSCS